MFELFTFAQGAVSDKYKPGRKIARWTLRLTYVFWYSKCIFEFAVSLKQSPVCFKPNLPHKFNWIFIFCNLQQNFGKSFFVVCPFAVLILSSFAFCNVLLLLLFPIPYLGNISNKKYHFICGFPKEWNSMTIVQKFTKRKKALGPWLMYLVFWLVCLASLNCDDICYIWYFGSICLGICCKTFYVKKL